MGSNMSSHYKGDLDVLVSPVAVAVSAKGTDIAMRIDKGEQACPGCQRSGGLTYTQKADVYTFKCSHCNLSQSRK
ncbi:hypothetical protein BGX30_006604 [Mortierella sp. GBA39]|nr:hypothetical protein BGX30_006604 [Mortierella sp. GBA39]